MRLRILEVSLGLESVGSSLESRVSSVEKRFGERVAELEDEVCNNIECSRKNAVFSERIESLQKEVGVHGDVGSQLSKIAYLEKGIQDMKDRLDEFDRKASDSNSQFRNSNDVETESLHLR
eukprot:12665770-Ditylum_brightwellii.AAC.1